MLFGPMGQLWGNPLYNWDYLEGTRYEWWNPAHFACTRNLRCPASIISAPLTNIISIPYGDKTAVNGKWKGPGIGLFHAVRENSGKCRLLQEDLGYITEKACRNRGKGDWVSSMKVLQFAFDGSEKVNTFV